MCSINWNVEILKHPYIYITHYIYCTLQNLEMSDANIHSLVLSWKHQRHKTKYIVQVLKHIDHPIAMLRIACRAPLHGKIYCRVQVFLLW